MKKLIVFAGVVAACGLIFATTVLGSDPAKGATNYTSLCVSCHGQEGKGDGPAAVALTPKPRDFTDCEVVGAITDEGLFKVIKEGGIATGKGAAMPAWGEVLGDEEINDLVAYIRSLCKQ